MLCVRGEPDVFKVSSAWRVAPRVGEDSGVEPETRYALSRDVHIAYQVVGDGAFDLIFVPGFVTHVELQWRLPGMGDFLRTLGSFSRLIRFDKRGTGMSDPVSGAPSLETRMDDVRAVMDAVGSPRAAFYGLSEGAAMSILFAATYPERTAALVVRSCSPRTMWAPDFPWGRKEEAYQREVDQALRVFASRAEAGEAVRALGMQTDDEVEAFIDYVRYSTSPGMLGGLYRMNKEIDIRHVPPAVSVPTLVLHGSEDQIGPVEAGAYTAQHIRPARFIELPGVGHVALGADGTRIQDEIERFLTDVWQAGGWEDTEPDRMLATILFTDIVDSTATAIKVGDRRWPRCLSVTTRWCAESCCDFAGARSTPRATASSPRSTGRPALSAVPAQSSTKCVSSACPSVSGCTRANVRWLTARSWASRSTPARGWPRRPTPTRCSSPARLRIWSQDQALSSSTVAHMS
jgi:pimeloyl-ACP methyl ester carboxylesterase